MCSARQVLSEYASHTPGSFLELDTPGRSFRMCSLQINSTNVLTRRGDVTALSFIYVFMLVIIMINQSR